MPWFWDGNKKAKQRQTRQDGIETYRSSHLVGIKQVNENPDCTAEHSKGSSSIQPLTSGREGSQNTPSEEFGGLNESSDEEISEDDGEETEDSGDSASAILHSHYVKKKTTPASSTLHDILTKRLVGLMETCGLNLESHAKISKLMDEESKRSFSLIADRSALTRSAARCRNEENSVIAEAQLGLINKLTNELNLILDPELAPKQRYELLRTKETLFERYGTYKGVLGRGSFGVIKVVESSNSRYDESDSNPKPLFAVKILHKKNKNEEKKALIERILSEFIISASLQHKNILQSVDLFITLPRLELSSANELSFDLTMKCANGPNLLTYMLTKSDMQGNHISYISLDEIDCFTKQIGKGLQYMHRYGVAHCDLKLENILVEYESLSDHGDKKSPVVLKISDFGKSSVFRTKWDSEENLCDLGPMGSKPYMSPEEFMKSPKGYRPYSMSKKDSWALGITIFILFNIRRYYYSALDDDLENDIESITYNDHNVILPWLTTEINGPQKEDNSHKYKDPKFEEYSRTRMKAKYIPATQEWIMERQSNFKPIEDVFKRLSRKDVQPIRNSEDSGEKLKRNDILGNPKDGNKVSDSTPSDTLYSKLADKDWNEPNKFAQYDDFEETDDLNDLRKMIIYKLLDNDPNSRMSVDQFMKTDWMASVDTCI